MFSYDGNHWTDFIQILHYDHKHRQALLAGGTNTRLKL